LVAGETARISMELTESRRIVPEWTSTRTLGRRRRSRGGLIRFYREIAGVGLVFPRGDRPIAVEFPGYPVVRLRLIEGLEFVEETVTALGYSTELAHHLFRECWAAGTGNSADLCRCSAATPCRDPSEVRNDARA
jgi:hypothetical protein